jgi:uncharacterized protein
VLIFAKHPALRSIAVISIIGIFCVVIMSQILIPFLFNILIKSRTQKKRFPWTFSGFLLSAFAFTYFAVASLVLTLIGIITVKLNPFDRQKGKKFYHYFVAAFTKSLIYIMGNVKKRIINPEGEDFSKAAVVICNHQSSLDVLVTVMLHPKLILFTNHRVWNSPVSGFVVRMADYYPVIQGVESSLEQIEEKVKQGYSVVVFPEGTRSVDGNIKRFHKGAFYLAEKLGLDILPLLIHGTGYTMTKNDFLLKNGTITLKFLPRITPSDRRFGEGYAARTKSTVKYFREEFQKLKQDVEDTSYYREQLLYNYLYKGPVLEWYLRIKLRLEKNYRLFHELLPKTGELLDAGCGYGFMSYMLHFTAPGRRITGVDYDEEKIATAEHCFSKDDGIHFVHSDILQFRFAKYDGIVVSDVLHYLLPDGQREIIGKCISSLNPGGTLIIRDADKDLAKRHNGTKYTEFVSTTFWGFNKTTEHGLSFLSADFIRQIAADHKVEYSIIDPSKYTSNIIFVIKNNAVQPDAAF